MGSKMINTFNNNEYDVLKYDGENIQKIKDFIREKYNLCISVIKPNIEVVGLEAEDYIRIIKPNDYIIRDSNINLPNYAVVENKVIRDRFICN